MNTPDIRIGWCGAIPSQYYVSITFRGPDTGVTIFSWSGVSDKFLGLWGVILTHPHALASQFISISLKGGFFSIPKLSVCAADVLGSTQQLQSPLFLEMEERAGEIAQWVKHYPSSPMT